MERGAYPAGSGSACRWSAVFRRIPTAARTAAANCGGDLSGQSAGVGGHWRGGVFQRIGRDDLAGKETFFFRERSRRPPLDAFNAMLSFAYSLLAHDCASALESVGLDAYVGYLHTDRPGRESLALDLMEELRPCFADRFVLTLINNRIIKTFQL